MLGPIEVEGHPAGCTLQVDGEITQTAVLEIAMHGVVRLTSLPELTTVRPLAATPPVLGCTWWSSP